MSDLRPGRLRAGPGVASIVPRRSASHDSFQLADRRDEQEAHDDRRRGGAPDDERLRGAKRGDDRGEQDRSEREEQRAAEEVDARDTAKELARYVLVHRGRPEHAHADEMDAEPRGEEQRRRDHREQADPGDRKPAHDREQADRYPKAPDRHLRQGDARDHLSHTDRRGDDAEKRGVAMEHVSDQDRQRNVERADHPEDHDGPAEDEDPQPRDRERVGEAFADLTEDRRGGGRLVSRRPSDPERNEAQQERQRVGREGDRKARERDQEPTHDRATQERGLARGPPHRVPGLEHVAGDELRNDRVERGLEERVARAEEGRLRIEVLEPQLARRGKERDRAYDDAAREVAREDHAAPRQAVRHRAADEKEHDRTPAEDAAPEAKLQRSAAEREDLERQGDRMHEVAEDRDGLAEPEQSEVAMPERLDDPRQAP